PGDARLARNRHPPEDHRLHAREGQIGRSSTRGGISIERKNNRVNHQSQETELLVVGAGVGGVAAALAALRRGRTVVMTEEHRWVGGQLTVQGTPPDEHPWLEDFGATASYRDFRSRVRAYYSPHYPLSARARRDPAFNPGNATVSKLAGEPRVFEAVL